MDTDPTVAAKFAGKNGVILRTTLEELRSRGINVLASPDVGEGEWLVEEIVDRLEVLEP